MELSLHQALLSTGLEFRRSQVPSLILIDGPQDLQDIGD